MQYSIQIYIKNHYKKIWKVPSKIIAPTQSAFLPRRLILDNIIVAYEMLHSMKTRKKGKIGSMAIKLDISKAYDQIK